MRRYFINKELESKIDGEIIKKTFPLLEPLHQKRLLEYLIDIVDIIAIKLNFRLERREEYEYQLFQNNGRDLIGILYLLLPFIDDDTGEKRKKLRSLDDLYIKKKLGSVTNINEGEPKYLYTNLQYGRCRRDKDNLKEISFDLEHLRHNYILLKQTIQIVSNKLFVNWLNVRPIGRNYDKTELYETTSNLNLIKNMMYWDPSGEDKGKNEEAKFNKGLYMGDIYNTITNRLFNGIKNIKWTIYDGYLNKRLYPYLILLNEIVPINTTANNIKYLELKDEERTKFVEGYKNLVSLASKNSYFKDINSGVVRSILKALIIFFEKYYSQISKAIALGEYKEIDKEISDEEDEEDIEKKIRYLDIKESAESLIRHSEHIYNFIKESVEKLHNTWYGKKIIKYDENEKCYYIKSLDQFNEEAEKTRVNDKVRDADIFYVKYNSILIQVSYKSIYNFAKSLTHYTKQVDNKSLFLKYPRFWRSLNSKEKKEILRRLNMDILTFEEELKEKKSWFDISSNIRLVFGFTDRESVISVNGKIFLGIQRMLIDIIFDVLYVNGTLTEFVLDRELTDGVLVPSTTKFKKLVEYMKKTLEEKVFTKKLKEEKWNESYYFLTGMKYSQMKKIIYKNRESGKLEESKYLDYLYKEFPGFWALPYALDWVSQLAFFHRYIHNRIFYVTGGTGVGKSTQIPKLLLYAVKMIDYKNDGKVICTQPRIAPVVGVPTNGSSIGRI